MKSPNANFLCLVLCMTIFLSGACSSHGVMNPSPPVSASINTPKPMTAEPVLVNTPIPTPTLLSFTGKIAFLRGHGNRVQLFVMNANGTGLTEITPPNLLWISNPSWSPDAQYIAFDAVTDTEKPIHQIYTIKADGSNLKQITFGQSSYRPRWSPDGKKIIFINYTELGIMKPDGTGIQKLFDGSLFDYSYRSDGSISVSIPATWDLTKTFIINSEGIVQDQLPNFPNRIVPLWSPDNKTVVATDIYRTNCCTDCTEIVVMKSDDYSSRACLKIQGITPPAVAGASAWSPDGKYILISANPDGKEGIYIVKPDGTDLIQLVNLDDVGSAVWAAGQ